MKKKVVAVIGSGFGGLATAIRLASHDLEVHLFEKHPDPGGRARTFHMDEFRFDGGPTVLTAPWMFDELFELANQERSKNITFLPVDPFYHIFDWNGRNFVYNADIPFVMEQIRKFRASDTDGYLNLLKAAEPMFEKGFLQLGQEPFLKLNTMLSIAPNLLRLRAHESVYRFVSRHIEDNFLRMCFSFHPLFIGGNPLRVSSIYTMIHLIERAWGVWYPKGGMGQLINALVQLFQQMGGNIHFQTEIQRITTQHGRVTGLLLKNGEKFSADYVVSNADVPTTYLSLLEDRDRAWRHHRLRYERFSRYSMSLVVWYFALNKKFTDNPLGHHNIVFGPRFGGLIHDIFVSHRLAEDFSMYIHLPTRTDPSMAPEAHETMYVLVPVPNQLSNIDWYEALPRLEERVTQVIDQHFMPGLKRHIVKRHVIDPNYFEHELNTYLGTGFSLEPHLTQSAWFRPHNASETVKGLYLVGAGTHPGAGIPGVLLSAKIVHKLILDDIEQSN
ncbi:phytoene desaturase family protein [Alicyclobacillus tolerans]|uniref:Phytoene dehydrogenase n=1 Tax=Alicyclobacillus tolerans TaxID=90970 RepID=A0ABT9LYV5_9BACL|nr:phytoene desaturase family protein [Alicyclobacillus tengchongensis]MDP9729454.1 phytoene desaturase [Alicyclobacillus tengchongensis]